MRGMPPNLAPVLVRSGPRDILSVAEPVQVRADRVGPRREQVLSREGPLPGRAHSSDGRAPADGQKVLPEAPDLCRRRHTGRGEAWTRTRTLYPQERREGPGEPSARPRDPLGATLLLRPLLAPVDLVLPAAPLQGPRAASHQPQPPRPQEPKLVARVRGHGGRSGALSSTSVPRVSDPCSSPSQEPFSRGLRTSTSGSAPESVPTP